MAEEETVDVGALSSSQQEALQTYTSVTDQEPAAAVALLRRSEWNVQIAITKFFDGEAAVMDPLEEAQRQAAAEVPRAAGSSGVLLDDLDGPGLGSVRYRRPIPRPGAGGLARGGGGTGPGRGDNRGWRPPLLLAIIFSPFTLIYRLLASGWNLLRDLWAGPPPPRPRGAARPPPPQLQQQQQSGSIENQGVRTEQDARQALRSEQETAYERSLAADREKVRLRKEAEAQREREEAQERRREQWRRWRAAAVAPEPPAEDKGAARLSIRMPNGERVVRRFAPATSMDDLYAFVDTYGVELDEKVGPDDQPEDYVHEYGFKLVQTMPRAVFLPDSASVTQRIGRSANLIVEAENEDTDDE